MVDLKRVCPPHLAKNCLGVPVFPNETDLDVGIVGEVDHSVAYRCSPSARASTRPAGSSASSSSRLSRPANKASHSRRKASHGVYRYSHSLGGWDELGDFIIRGKAQAFEPDYPCRRENVRLMGRDTALT